MDENKVRIADVAEELGLSTATVSNVLHGKTHKMSEATIKHVEQKLEETPGIVNLVIDHYDGGYQAGQYYKKLGHTKALCLADNEICMDKERMDGFTAAFAPGEVTRWKIPMFVSVLLSAVGAVVVSGVLMLFSGSYVGFYRVDTTVQELGQSLLFVFALYAPVKIENMILGGGILKSGGDTKTVMLIDIVGTWGMGIPLCFAGAYLLQWGIVGVYALLTSEEILRLVISLVIFRKKKWMISLA